MIAGADASGRRDRPEWLRRTIAARWDGRRATPENVAERFFAKVDKTDDCWLWRGGTGGNHYGKFRPYPGAKHTSAHRIAYELIVGPIPAGLHLDHVCQNPQCVNPAHLEPVTAAENRRRQSARQTHCRRGGHPLSGSNLYVGKDGRRYCRRCRRDAQRRYLTRTT